MALIISCTWAWYSHLSTKSCVKSLPSLAFLYSLYIYISVHIYVHPCRSIHQPLLHHLLSSGDILILFTTSSTIFLLTNSLTHFSLFFSLLASLYLNYSISSTSSCFISSTTKSSILVNPSPWWILYRLRRHLLLLGKRALQPPSRWQRKRALAVHASTAAI